MEADLKIFDVVDSTNISLARMADEGAAEGTCVVSFSQRFGQGRSGRSFFSPDGGNLYMSLLLRPDDDAVTSMITVAAAAATTGAIRSVFGIDTGIKWVNDIILNDKKVCGIIAQAHNVGEGGYYVVLGIGINIYRSEEVPEDIAGIYGSLFDHACMFSADKRKEDALRLAKEIIRRFSGYYECKGLGRCIDDYRKDCIVTGREVLYVSGDSVTEATAVGITDTGAIILDVGGSRQVFRDGEIRIRIKDKNLAL